MVDSSVQHQGSAGAGTAAGGRVRAPAVGRIGKWAAAALKPAVAARLLLGLGVIAVAFWYGSERIFYRVSLEGVVNSPVLVLRSPIDGDVVKSLARPGLVLSQATELVQIENPRIDAQMAALDQRVAQLTAMRDELTQRVEEHRAATVEHLQRSVGELDAMVQSAQSALARSSADDMRAQQLLQETLASRQRVDETKDELRRAQADLERLTAMRERMRGDLTAAEHGILVGEGYGDVPYSQQRIDEIRLTLAELAQQRVGLDQSRTASLSAPAGAVVRSVDVRAGSEVVRDDPLAEVLDCSRAYVEAALPERGFDKVRPGSTAIVTLRGNSAELHATVRALHGAALAQEGGTSSAAVLDRPTSDAMTVLLDVDPAELRAYSDGRCQVGREATVVFAH
jgi:multidrug resistance efflux pump